MSTNSAIEWTETTWNPITGCTKCSLGCSHCYALPMSHRLQAMGQKKYAGTTQNNNGKTAWTGQFKFDENALKLPGKWIKPRIIFVNSMSDLFHQDIPDPWISRVFRAMNDAPWHVYQLLTKRSDRLLYLNPRLPWHSNIWMGVTVENADYTFRIDHLRQTGAEIKFISFEPLLGPIPEVSLNGIDWVIVGGESGPGARPMKPEWVTDIRDQCQKAGVSFFFKQWGGRNKKLAGRMLEGRTWDEMPRPCEKSSDCLQGQQGIHEEIMEPILKA